MWRVWDVAAGVLKLQVEQYSLQGIFEECTYKCDASLCK